jgi:hypothetical protein
VKPETNGTSVPRDLVGLLRSFNRKERFLLVAWAVDRPNFLLGDDFRRTVFRASGLRIPS